MPRAWMLLLLLCLSAGSRDEPVIRVTVNLVQVDAVLLQDGKRRAIKQVSFVSTAAPRPVSALPAAAPTPDIAPVREQVARTIVPFIDGLGLGSEARKPAAAASQWIGFRVLPAQ